MDFSVLLTIYIKDSPQFLEEALASVFDQTILPTEVIIVGDGPLNEDLLEVVYKFEKQYSSIIKLVLLPENIGTGYAINEGLKACSYDLVAKMDSDDICFPYRFERQLERFNLNPELSFVGASIAEFTDDDRNNVVSYRVLPENHKDIVSYAKKRCPLNQPVVMYRKSAIMECGGYRKFTFGEDYDLWVRAILKGYFFYNIQEPLLYFRTNIDTVRKRGSFWYLKIDLSHHYDFYKMGFLSLPELIYNSFIRICVRLSPLKLRKMIYTKLLRSK